jgi:hypothetical protein
MFKLTGIRVLVFRLFGVAGNIFLAGGQPAKKIIITAY